MTGQVKEDIICRWGEFGVFAKEGSLHFDPQTVRSEEFLAQEEVFEYYDIHNNKQSLVVPVDALGFTYCQIPVVYHNNHSQKGIELTLADNKKEFAQVHHLNKSQSKAVFERSGEIQQINVYIK